MPTPPHVTLYSRRECCLCDDMKAELDRRGYRVTVVDIDGDRELKRKFGWDIPVAVLDDGTVLAKHRL